MIQHIIEHTIAVLVWFALLVGAVAFFRDGEWEHGLMMLGMAILLLFVVFKRGDK